MGNGLTHRRDYDKKANRLRSATLQTGDGLNTNPINRLKEDYEYDSLGNVSRRSQYWDNTGFSETFGYDELNRIIESQVSGQAQQVFTYNAVGNLTSKTGVGTGGGNSGGNLGATYLYPVQGSSAIRPHAVDSIPGIGSFSYDDNGNLLSGAGRSLTWTSFDMPATVAKAATVSTPAASASFVYGPEHQRTRQIRSDGSSVVYAGPQEVETKAGLTTIKTYWPYGVGVEIDRNLSSTAIPNNNNSELNWTHTDRLGSPVAMSTSTGTLREKLAYDAWGKRRTLDGAPIGVGSSATPTPDSLDGITDNRGFTGHEMLDQLDLVHMNGRIYDPLTARFMSADPILQDPMNGQSYNRYSYVMNNPTNLTDPTGFASEECKSCPTGLTYIGSSSVKVYGEGGTGFSLTGQNDRQSPSDASMRTVAGLMPKTQGAEGFFKVSVKQHPPSGSGENDITTVPSTNYSFGLRDATLEKIDNRVAELGSTPVAKALGVVSRGIASVIPDNPLEAATAVALGFWGKLAALGRPTIGAANGEKVFERVLSSAELKATRETGLLRGGRADENFFTNSASLDAKRAHQRLGLDGPLRDYRIQFQIKNDVKVTGPRPAAPGKSGTAGGGQEFSTNGQTQIDILRVDQLRR